MKQFIEFANESDALFEQCLLENIESNDDKRLLEFIDPISGALAVGAAAAIGRHVSNTLTNMKHRKLAIAAYRSKHGVATTKEMDSLVKHKNNGVRLHATRSLNLSHSHVKKLLKDNNYHVRKSMENHYGKWLANQGRRFHNGPISDDEIKRAQDEHDDYDSSSDHDDSDIFGSKKKIIPTPSSLSINPFHKKIHEEMLKSHVSSLHATQILSSNGVSSSAYQAKNPVDHDTYANNIHDILLNHWYHLNGTSSSARNFSPVYSKGSSHFEIYKSPTNSLVELRHSHNIDDFREKVNSSSVKPESDKPTSSETQNPISSNILHSEHDKLHKHLLSLSKGIKSPESKPVEEPAKSPESSIKSFKDRLIDSAKTVSTSNPETTYDIHQQSAQSVSTPSKPTVISSSKLSGKKIHENLKSSVQGIVGPHIKIWDNPSTALYPASEIKNIKDSSEKDMIKSHLHNTLISQGFVHSKEQTHPKATHQGLLKVTNDTYEHPDGHKFNIASTGVNSNNLRIERKSK